MSVVMAPKLATYYQENNSNVLAALGPGKFCDLFPSSSRSSGLPLGILKQMNDALDLTTGSIGPDPVKRSNLLVLQAQTRSLQWAEEENITLGRRQHAYSATRHKLPKWATSDYIYHGTIEWIRGVKGGLTFNIVSAERKAELLHIPSEWKVSPQFFADRNAVRTASCIGLADQKKRMTIRWEKERLSKLNEQESVLARILDLQRDINHYAMQIQDKINDRIHYESELYRCKEHKEKVMGLILGGGPDSQRAHDDINLA